MAKMRKDVESVGENEIFVTLVMAAEEDEGFGRRIAALLALPAFQRGSLLGSMIQELQVRGAKPELLAACAALRSDDVAEAFRNLLATKTRGR